MNSYGREDEGYETLLTPCARCGERREDHGDDESPMMVCRDGEGRFEE